jgi:hypothetical protein
MPMAMSLEVIITYSSGNKTAQPSPLMKVSGQELDTFFNGLTQIGLLQDPDVLYSSFMFEMALDTQSVQTRYTGFFVLAWRFGYLYPGDKRTN